MSDPIEKIDNVLTLGILAAVVIGAIWLFEKLDIVNLFKGLPLMPGAPTKPEAPGGPTNPSNPLNDVSTFAQIFTAQNPGELWDNFLTWFQGEFLSNGGDNSGFPGGTGQLTPEEISQDQNSYVPNTGTAVGTAYPAQ